MARHDLWLLPFLFMFPMHDISSNSAHYSIVYWHKFSLVSSHYKAKFCVHVCNKVQKFRRARGLGRRPQSNTGTPHLSKPTLTPANNPAHPQSTTYPPTSPHTITYTAGQERTGRGENDLQYHCSRSLHFSGVRQEARQ